MFGDADLPGHAAGGLRQHGFVGGAAAAPHAAAAPVEQAQAHLVFGKQFHQSLLGLIQHPLAGYITAVFIAVGIAEHDFLNIAAAGEQVAVPRQGEKMIHHADALLQRFDGFKQRHDVEPAFR